PGVLRDELLDRDHRQGRRARPHLGGDPHRAPGTRRRRPRLAVPARGAGPRPVRRLPRLPPLAAAPGRAPSPGRGTPPVARGDGAGPVSGRLAVTLFSGGRGGASIARGLLRTPGVELTLVINGYDNGRSTGALRRYLPGMLGPSDFRKNLLLHLDEQDPQQAALRTVLERRLSPATAREELRAIPGLPPRARALITRDLSAFLRRFDHDPGGLDLTDCALG